jgi:hypothetical protein
MDEKQDIGINNNRTAKDIIKQVVASVLNCNSCALMAIET